MKKFLIEVLSEPLAWVTFYIFMFINTFGHSWVNLGKNPLANEGGLMVVSFVSAMCWPLYWSVKFWS